MEFNNEYKIPTKTKTKLPPRYQERLACQYGWIGGSRLYDPGVCWFKAIDEERVNNNLLFFIKF